MSKKRYVFRGDNGWNDLLTLKQNDKVTIIPEAINGVAAGVAPDPLMVPATEDATNGWNTNIEVAASQELRLVAEGKWQGENAAEWEHVFQFDTASGSDPDTTYGDGEWTLNNDPYSGSGTCGRFTSGTGWQECDPEYAAGSGYKHRSCRIYRTFPAAHITSVAVTYDATKGGGSTGGEKQGLYVHIDADDADEGTVIDEQEVITQFGTNQSIELEVTLNTVEAIGIDMRSGIKNGADPGGTVTIKQVVVKGTGANPFKEWTHTFEFTQERSNIPEVTYGDGGFVEGGYQMFGADLSNREVGTYVAGSGWETEELLTLTTYDVAASISKTFSTTTLTHISVTYNRADDSTTHPYKNAIWFTDNNPVVENTVEGDDQIISWDGEQETDKFGIQVWPSGSGASQFYGSGLIKSVTVRGLGVNPFDVTAESGWVGPEGEIGTSAPSGFKLETVATKYALLYRIGTTGNWATVGTSKSITPSSTNTLYLAMNDDDYTDNAGSLQVYIEVIGRADGSCDDADTRIDTNEAADALLYRIGTGSATAIDEAQADFTAGSSGKLQITRNGCDANHYAVSVIVNAQGEADNQNQECGDCDEGMIVAGQPCSDNPIQLKDGNKVQSFTDLVLNAPTRPLTFIRRYNQINRNDNNDFGFMGLGWSHNHRYLMQDPVGTTPNRTVDILLPDGGTLSLTETSSNHFDADSGSTAELDYVSSEWVLTLPSRGVLVFEGTSTHTLKRREWPNGDTWTYNYVSGDLNYVKDDYGNQIDFTYYSGETGDNTFKNGQLKTISDSASRTVTLDYIPEKDAGVKPTPHDALLGTVTDVRGEDWGYDYYGQDGSEGDDDQLNMLTERLSPQVDAGTADGTITLEKLTYTLSGSTVTDINQERGDGLIETDFAFQPNGVNITEEVFAKNDANHELKTIHHFAQGVYVGAANPSGHMPIQVIDDAHYRPSLQEDAQGNATQLSWSTDGRQLTAITDAQDNQTSFDYDSEDRLIVSIDAQGRRTTYAYDDSNAPRQPTEIRVYAADGTLLSLQEFDYGSRTYNIGKVTEERLMDPANETTALRTIKRVYRSTTPGKGLLDNVEQIGEDDPKTTYTYDDAGRIIKTRKESLTGNCEYSFTVYDAAGNVVATVCGRDNITPIPDSVTDARNAFDSNDPTKFTVTVHEYDELGRRIKTIANDGNSVSERTSLTAYDALNRVVRTVDNYVSEVGVNPYTAAHNAFDHGVEDNENLVTDTAYNKRGLVRKQTDVLGNVTLFGYDDAGRLVKTVRNASLPSYDNDYIDGSSDPDLSLYSASTVADEDLVTEQVYDANGNLVKSIDPLGNVTYTIYDSLNRVVKTVVNAKDDADITLNPGDTNYAVADDPRSDHYEADTASDRDFIQTSDYDALGRVSQAQDVLDRVTRYLYDDTGRQSITIANFTGGGVHNGQQPDLNIVSQTVFDDEGQVTQTIDTRGNETRYSYDELGQQTEVIRNYVDGTSSNPDEDLKTTTTHDGNGRVTVTVDPAGIKTQTTYDSDGRPHLSIRNYVESFPPNLDWSWSEARRQWEYAASQAVDHGSDFDQNLVTETLYDDAGRVESIRDDRGTLTQFGYDILGRRVSVTQAVGTYLETTHITCYDRAGRVLRTIQNYHPIQAGASVPAEAKDADGNILPGARASNGDWYFDPSTHGSRHDRNLITVYDYDDLGRRTKVTDPAGNETTTTYFKDGAVDTVTDPEGVKTVYRYDAARRRQLVVQNFVDNSYEPPEDWVFEGGVWKDEASGTTIDHGTDNDQNIIVLAAHDRGGRMTTLRDPLGRQTYYGYDQLNRRTVQVLNYVEQQNGSSQVILPENWVWDADTHNRWELPDGTEVDHDSGTAPFVNDQNLIRQTDYTEVGQEMQSVLTDVKGVPISQGFDRVGRLTSLGYNDPANTYDVDFAYDVAGNRTTMSEYNNSSHIAANLKRETSFGYDDLRRLTSVGFDNNGNGTVDETVSYDYDLSGNRTGLTLPNNDAIAYQYDEQGRLIGLTDWDDQHSDFHYDGVGRHVGTQRANGLLTDYLYDSAGRLRRVRHLAGTSLRALFAYAVDGRGNRTQAYEKVATGTTVDDTLTKSDTEVTFPAGTWTDDGSLKKTVQFSSRMEIAYSGDEALLTIGVGPDHGLFDVYLNGWFWRSFDGYADSDGEKVIHIPEVTTPQGESSGTLEIRNRADHNRQSTGHVFRFKQLEVIDTTYDDQTWTYTYDNLSRIATANLYDGTNLGVTAEKAYAYDFDEAGNRTKQSLSLNGATAVVTDYQYTEVNQLARHHVDAGSWTNLTYDLNGNLTNDGTNAFTWDRANRMLTAPGSTSYKYDGLGNRIQQTVSSVVTDYLLDMQPGLVKVLKQDDGTDVDHYIHAVRGIHAQYDGTDWQDVIQDGLGSVRGLIDDRLEVDATQSYGPYGNPDGSYGAGFGYAGEQIDGNGLSYNRARYYDPDLGVFTALEPLETANRYAYVVGNPISRVDPSGLIFIDIDDIVGGVEDFGKGVIRGAVDIIDDPFRDIFIESSESQAFRASVNSIVHDATIIPRLFMENPQVAQQALIQWACQNHIPETFVTAVSFALFAGVHSGSLTIPPWLAGLAGLISTGSTVGVIALGAGLAIGAGLGVNALNDALTQDNTRADEDEDDDCDIELGVYPNIPLVKESKLIRCVIGAEQTIMNLRNQTLWSWGVDGSERDGTTHQNREGRLPPLIPPQEYREYSIYRTPRPSGAYARIVAAFPNMGVNHDQYIRNQMYYTEHYGAFAHIQEGQ